MSPLVTIGDLPLFGTDPDGVEWFVPKNGLDWSGAPGSTIEVKQRPRGNGGLAGEAFLSSRSYSLTGNVVAGTRAAVEDALDRLTAAASIGGARLLVVEDGRTRWAEVRRDDEIVVEWDSDTAATWSTGLVNLDGRRFADPLTIPTGLPSTTGGLTVPFTVPFTIPAVTVTGQVSLTNPGNIAGPVSLRIDGPVTGPIVTHVSSGRSLVFASSLVLAAGEFVTVDMEKHLVLAQGQSSRAGWVTQRGWSQFEPGVNTWAFSALAHSPTASLTVTATPAWQ